MLGNDNDRRLGRDAGTGRAWVLDRVVQWLGMRGGGGLSLPALGRLRTSSGELGSRSAVVGERTKQNWLNVVSSSSQPGGSDEVRVRLSRCVASSRSLEEWYLPERSRSQSSGSRSCCSRPTVVQWRWCVVLTSSLVVSSSFCERVWISDQDFQIEKVNSLQSSDSISVIGRDQVTF